MNGIHFFANTHKVSAAYNIHVPKRERVSNIRYKLVCAYSKDSNLSAHQHSLMI